MPDAITIHGPEGSPYVMTLTMALDEKGLAYDLVQLPMPDYKSAAYLSERHPFGKVPSAQIGAFSLYETEAILRLIEELHPQPSLTPDTPHRRARMNQIMGIVDCYGWPSIAGGILLNRVMRPQAGAPPVEAEVTAALPRARTSVQAFADLMEPDAPFLCGPRISMADFFVYPLLMYFNWTAEGAPLIAGQPRLADWLARMDARQAARLPASLRARNAA